MPTFHLLSMRTFLTTLILSLSGFTLLVAQGIQFHEGTWLSALEQAGRDNKLIFMDCYTTWCGPCKMMDRQTFPDASVGELYNEQFINVKMDMEKGEGIDLARAYNIQAYPTLLFLDPAGQVVHRVAGFHKPDQFIELARTALDPNRKLQALDEQYVHGDRDAGFLYSYAYVRLNAMDGSHYPVALEYLATQEDWSITKNMEFIFDFAEYVDGDLFRYIIEHRSDYVEHYGPTAVNRKIDEVINLANFYREPDWDQLKQLLQDIYPNDVDRQLAYFQMNFYMQSGQIDDFTRAALDFYKIYPATDADALNDAAWSFYEHVQDPKALKEAVKWAQQAVKWADNYYNNDTLAALYAKLGKKSKARKVALHAIELAKASGQDYSLTQELLDQL
ncbi:MAG TPA: thioredoxin family protein [Saprospiraceae bacterium]|nr:thioredoxin family protein [Saprospiraceae bacterium]HRW75048.1 thioredoxin family protein [Saprospiraceae bacterium]